MHKKQIAKLIGETKEAGGALDPLKIYLKNDFAKVLIGLGYGKKRYDKREEFLGNQPEILRRSMLLR